MAISGSKYTRLNNELEKRLVELGGYNPEKPLTVDELVDALVKAIELIADHKPEQIEKIFHIVTERLGKVVSTSGQSPAEPQEDK